MNPVGASSQPEWEADNSSPLMALVPRWQYMTDEAKALTKRVAVSALVVLGATVLLRSLLPWVIVAVLAWWIWRAVRR